MLTNMFDLYRILLLVNYKMPIPMEKSHLFFYEAMLFLGITFTYYLYSSYVMPLTRQVMIILGCAEWLIMPEYIYLRLCQSIWDLWWSFLFSMKGEVLLAQDLQQFEARRDVTVLFTFHTVFLAHQVWLGLCKQEMSKELLQKILLMALSCSSLFWQPYFGIIFLLLVNGVITVLAVAQLTWCLQLLNAARAIGITCWPVAVLYTGVWLMASAFALPNLMQYVYHYTLHTEKLQSFFDLPGNTQYGFAIGSAYILLELTKVPTVIWCTLLVEDARNVFHMRSLERVLFKIPSIPRQ